MKRSFKHIAILMALILTITTVPMPAYAASTTPTVKVETKTAKTVKVTAVRGTTLQVKPTWNKKSVAKSAPTYKSLKKSVATVSKTGLVKLKQTGKTTINVKYKGKTTKLIVTVVEYKHKLNYVRLNKSTLKFSTPASVTLKPKLKPTNAENCTITWRSKNPAVATVDKNGVVTPQSNGKTVITCTATQGKVSKSINCNITVNITSPGSPTGCKHNWVLMKGEHHDAVYKWVHHDAVLEYYDWCQVCGLENPSDDHLDNAHSWEEPGYGFIGQGWRITQEAYDEKVLVTAAYDDPDYYRCSKCWSTKAK